MESNCASSSLAIQLQSETSTKSFILIIHHDKNKLMYSLSQQKSCELIFQKRQI